MDMNIPQGWGWGVRLVTRCHVLQTGIGAFEIDQFSENLNFIMNSQLQSAKLVSTVTLVLLPG